MKRSEMIDYLTALLELPRSEQISNKALAEEILTALEVKGMVPPEIETEHYDRANCEYFRVHEWEEETES